MDRTTFAVIWAAIAVLIFGLMWWGWRRRSVRDRGLAPAGQALVGEVLETFTDVLYVSTTLASDPLARIAAPSLKYRGYADVEVRSDGVVIEVRGESPVYVGLDQLQGSSTATSRAGKAVERDGLALLRWARDGRELESSFRFNDRRRQGRFLEAVERVSHQSSDQHFSQGKDDHS